MSDPLHDKIIISPDELPIDWRDLPMRLKRAEDELRKLQVENATLRDDVIRKFIEALSPKQQQLDDTPTTVGARVSKSGSGYSGPGIIRAEFRNHLDQMRVVVGHTIEGGSGEFYHIYSADQINYI